MPTVAIDATYAVDPRPTGVSVYSRRLIESLAEIESPHRFLIGYRWSRWRRRKGFIRFESRRSYPKFSTFLFQDPWTFWLPWRAELFHSLAQRPAPFHFRKEVVTIFDVFPLSGRNYSPPSFQRKFSALLREAVNRASRIITPSRYTADELTRLTSVQREKIRIIPLGVDMPRRNSDPLSALAERERWVGKGNELILIVGVIQTRKNTLGALRALEQLPRRYRMVLVGGDGYGSESVHDYIRKAGLGERVRVAGYLSPEEVEKLYWAASVLLFPSLEEGFGLPVLEAIAHSLAVVTAGTSSLPEVGGDAALYVDPHDPDEIAAKTLQICEDQAVRNVFIQKGLIRAREFTWRRTALETLRVYNEMLSE